MERPIGRKARASREATEEERRTALLLVCCPPPPFVSVIVTASPTAVLSAAGVNEKSAAATAISALSPASSVAVGGFVGCADAARSSPLPPTSSSSPHASAPTLRMIVAAPAPRSARASSDNILVSNKLPANAFLYERCGRADRKSSVLKGCDEDDCPKSKESGRPGARGGVGRPV